MGDSPFTKKNTFPNSPFTNNYFHFHVSSGVLFHQFTIFKNPFARFTKIKNRLSRFTKKPFHYITKKTFGDDDDAEHNCIIDFLQIGLEIFV